jgi:hypothetical protein
MKRGRQLDHTEASAEMATRNRHHVDQFLTQLLRELIELRPVQSAQLVWFGNLVE